MSYVPEIMGVPPSMSFGQGYGNWQQYAGFNKTSDPFGGSSGLGVEPTRNVISPSVIEPSAPDIAALEEPPVQPLPQNMGVAPSINQGLALPSVKAPSLMDSVESHYGVK